MGKEEEAIEGSNEDNVVELTLRENEKTLETNLDDDHNDILSTLLSHDHQVEERGDDESSRDIDCLSDEQLEALLVSEYRELLGQTEEKLGEPVADWLSKTCKRIWGQAVLNKDKKEELCKGLDVPLNCKELKVPKLNTSIYIRVNENAQT